jgi:hypothetical protein
MYAFTFQSGRAVLIFRFNSPDAAIKQLQAEGALTSLKAASSTNDSWINNSESESEVRSQ